MRWRQVETNERGGDVSEERMCWRQVQSARTNENEQCECVGGKLGVLGRERTRTSNVSASEVSSRYLGGQDDGERTNENERCECIGGKFGALGERLDI